MRADGKTELSQEKINSVMELFSNGNYEKALKTLSFLMETYPNNSLLFNIKGACYAGLGQLENAVKSYKKAVLINPKYSKAHYNLGGAFHELGALDDSV